MEAAVNIPRTRMELFELGTGLVRFPGTWEEYWELLGQVEYNIEYQNGEIIAMGYETNQHGNIIFTLSLLFGNIFSEDSFQGFMENRPVFIKTCKKVFNPDVMLIDGPSELFHYAPGLNAETNPFLVAEVLSKSTYDHDWENKLPCYQELPAVEQILFIESRFPAVTLFTRNNDRWDKAFYNEKEETLQVRGHAIPLEAIYRKTDYFKKRLRT